MPLITDKSCSMPVILFLRVAQSVVSLELHLPDAPASDDPDVVQLKTANCPDLCSQISFLSGFTMGM